MEDMGGMTKRTLEHYKQILIGYPGENSKDQDVDVLQTVMTRLTKFQRE